MKRERIDIQDEEGGRKERGSYRRRKHDLAATHFRAAITNDHSLLTRDVDLRSVNARRFRDVLALLEADMGGSDHLSTAQLSLMRRFAMSAVLAEIYEDLFVARLDDREREGDAKLFGETRQKQYVALANLQIKLAEVLNLHKGRTPRDVTPPADGNGKRDDRNDYAAASAWNTQRIFDHLDAEEAA